MIDQKRIQVLNKKKIVNGLVVYWMYRDQRVADNWALLRAQELALEQKVPLVVVVSLRTNLHKYRGTKRWLHFMAEGLEEVARELKKKQIGFKVLFGDPEQTLPAFLKKYSIGAVICDFSPLRTPRSWQKKLAKKSSIRWELVDAHNIVPVWIASDKQEYAARTIRPKINRQLGTFLTEFPQVKKHPHFWGEKSIANVFEVIMKKVKVDSSIEPVTDIKSGSKAAQKVLRYFLSKRLANYDEKRNDPSLDYLSNLSPYLHFGQIAPQRVALEVDKTKSSKKAKEIFLEELIIRRELSDNFCYYNPNYDSLKGAPEWAQKTLQKHAKDPREYEYTYEQFCKAQTHDEAWNAAQKQLLQTGKMHGYMRMYWAKKILEWTASSKRALEIAIELNDLYEIDGRDPNGYVGILWSMAGVHDRGWTERPVFGKVRYMNYQGLKRKFEIEDYISRFT